MSTAAAEAIRLAFGRKAKGQVFALLLSEPDRHWTKRQLASRVGISGSAAARVLRDLVAARFIERSVWSTTTHQYWVSTKEARRWERLIGAKSAMSEVPEPTIDQAATTRAARELADIEAGAIEGLCRAFMQQSGLPPEKCLLVRKDSFEGGKMRVEWFCQENPRDALTAEDTVPKGASLRASIKAAINHHSAENGSDTPDFLLAEFLVGCLAVFDKTVRAREGRYGRDTEPG